MNLNELKIKSNGARKEIIDNYENCSESRWKQKTVLDKFVIYDGKSLENVSIVGRGSMILSAKHSLDNRFNLCVTTNTDIENITPRPSTTLKFNLDHLNLEKYNRMSAKIYIEATGYQNFYCHFTFGNAGYLTNHAPSLEPNKWNYVTWECDYVKRDDCNSFSITPYLMGCPDEALPVINIYLDNITAEVVQKEYDNGWDLDSRIAYCHSGYLPVSKKIAITGIANDEFFYVTNQETEKKYKLKVKEFHNNLGNFYLLDFSNVTDMGTYYIELDDRKTKPFQIDFICYDSSIWKSMNFLRLLRCGEDIPGVHSPCHLNCKTVHPINGKTIPNFGGWHDAGDVSQFEICTAEMTSAILDLAETLKSDIFLYERLMEEAKVGLNWLLRTRFGDGYRAMAVLYNIWRKNVLDPTNTSVMANKAEAGAFENFLSSNALILGFKMFEKTNKIFSDWCKRAAIEDFNFAKEQYENNIFTVRWGSPVQSQTCGAACLVASELYDITNDEKYLELAYNYANLIIECQEKGTENVPLKGFFYEDKEHNFILSYEHRGHEQCPIQGLVRLYQVAPESPFKDEIKKSLDLYRSYILDSMKYSSPYNLLPGHIYHLNKINIEHFTIPAKVNKDEALIDLQNQIKGGIDLGNGWYLRLFPISYSRRGFHTTLLSKTKAVSLLSKVLRDQDLKNVVLNQIEWILGKNPFATSTMFGEGYNYHPLYVAFSRQMVGALPVGIKTLGNTDAPYWPTVCNAVFKEIWGCTTGKYLWVLADIL